MMVWCKGVLTIAPPSPLGQSISHTLGMYCWPAAWALPRERWAPSTAALTCCRSRAWNCWEGGGESGGTEGGAEGRGGEGCLGCPDHTIA